MDRLIEIKVGGNHLWKDSNLAGVQGEGNVTSLRISFDEGWDSYAKSITFFDAKGRNPVKRTLTVDLLEDIAESARVYLCKIPPEPMVHAGRCSFVIEGYVDEQRQRVVETELEVLPARDTTGATEPSEPTPTQAEQLQAQLDAIIDDVRTAAVGAQYAEQAIQYAAEAKVSAEAAAASEENAGASASSASESAERAEQALSQMGTDAEEAAASAAAAAAAKNDAESAAARAETAQVVAEAARQEATSSATSAAESAQVAGFKLEEVKSNASMVQTNTSDAWSYMKSASESQVAASNAQAAAEAARTAAQTAQTAAQAAQVAAEKARDEAQQTAGGGFATPAYVDSKAQQAEENAKDYTDEKLAGFKPSGGGDMMASVYDPAGLKMDIFRYVGDMTSDALTDAYAYADELLENAQVSSGGGVLECYLDQTEFWEVNDAYQNGSTVVMWDNNELWPMVYAETDVEYRFQSVSPDGIRTAYLTEEGWSNGYDEFSSGGSAYSMARIGWVELPADAWESDGHLHSQVVDIEGVTEYSQVDLTPGVEQLAVFYEKDLTFVTENENGVVTVYAIGQKPTNDYTIQVTITEVEV